MQQQSAKSGECHSDPRVERTQAAVLAAAADLLLTGGPDQVTHARVAAAANVSRTTVYKHWPVRTDLLRATIEEVGKTLPEEHHMTGDLRADLRLMLEGLVSDLQDDDKAGMMATMIARARYDPAVAAVRDAMIGEIASFLGEIITAAVERGEIRAGVDAEQALASLGGTLIFTRLFFGRTIDNATADRVVDDFIAANAPA